MTTLAVHGSRLRDALSDATFGVMGYTRRDFATAHGRVHVLAARGRGDAPPIVLLHGLSSQGADFLPLLGRLRPAARLVVAPDLPGHGRSEVPRNLGDLDAAALGIAEALDETVDEPSIVFGNSFGGLLALRLAVLCPQLVRGLFLASPVGAPSSAAEIAHLGRVLRIETHADALAFMERVLHARRPLLDVLAWGLRRRFASPVVRAVVARLHTEALLDPADLRSLDKPVHVLWGGRDRLLPRSHLAFFRAHLPHAHVHEPPHVGHSPHLDALDHLVEWLVAFARRC